MFRAEVQQAASVASHTATFCSLPGSIFLAIGFI
jgi:hypothetical protein